MKSNQSNSKNGKSLSLQANRKYPIYHRPVIKALKVLDKVVFESLEESNNEHLEDSLLKHFEIALRSPDLKWLAKIESSRLDKLFNLLVDQAKVLNDIWYRLSETINQPIKLKS